jgi:YfiH family protein
VELLAVDLGPGVRAGFTRRRGGTGQPPYDGFNLALHVGADPEDVASNRAVLAEWVGAPVTFGRQVHGCRVLAVTAEPADALHADAAAEDGCDALVTTAPQTALGVLVADCVPVLLADPLARVVAVAHAGRVGLLAGILESVLEAMGAAGASADRIRAALGPAAGPCCYEVPEEMRDRAGARIPEVVAVTRWGTPSLDLRAGCRAVLASRGVDAVDVGGCTLEDPLSYSYRREPVTGRFAGVIRLLP